jgi:hypothetical protein
VPCHAKTAPSWARAGDNASQQPLDLPGRRAHPQLAQRYFFLVDSRRGVRTLMRLAPIVTARSLVVVNVKDSAMSVSGAGARASFEPHNVRPDRLTLVRRARRTGPVDGSGASPSDLQTLRPGCNA